MKKSLIVLLAVSMLASGLVKAVIKGDAFDRHERTLKQDGETLAAHSDALEDHARRLGAVEGSRAIAGVPAQERETLMAMASVVSQFYFNDYIFYSFWLAAAMMSTDQQARDWAYSWVYSEVGAKSSRPTCMYGLVESTARVLGSFVSTMRHPVQWIYDHPYLAMFQLLAFEEAMFGYAHRNTLLGSIRGFGAPKVGGAYDLLARVGTGVVDNTAGRLVRGAARVPGVKRVVPGRRAVHVRRRSASVDSGDERGDC